MIRTKAAPQSKNTVFTNIIHSRYIHLMSNFLSIHFHMKRLYVHMFDIINTPFIYGRGLIMLITLGIFQGKRKYSACDLKCRYCVFTLWGRKVHSYFTAKQQRYRCINYLPTAAQHTAPHLKFTLMECYKAVVCAEMEI